MFVLKTDVKTLGTGIAIVAIMIVNMAIESKLSIAQSTDINDTCDVGGLTPNWPSLNCGLAPKFENGVEVGEECVGQALGEQDACSGYVTKEVFDSICVTGTNPPEIVCKTYLDYLQIDAKLAGCKDATVDGEGNPTGCPGCEFLPSTKIVTVQYTDCADITTL